MRGRHGGQAAQAKRRGEEWIGCNSCGQPHGRTTYPIANGDRISPFRLLGLVIFCLVLWGVMLYAMPVVLIGLMGSPA